MESTLRDVRDHGRRTRSQENCATVAESAHNSRAGPQKSAIPGNDGAVRGIGRMPNMGARWGVAVAVLASFAAASAWFGYSSSGARVAKDYEDCAEEAKTNSTSNVEYTRSVTLCSERFAGRRKPGGGYSYFDFMQNRSFDIAGPNPTESERKKIDRTYMDFLGAQRREMLLSDLAKAQANEEQAALGRNRQDAEGPLALAPKIPLPVKRPPVERLKSSCEDGSLSCSWAKLSAAVKNAFASSGANR